MGGGSECVRASVCERESVCVRKRLCLFSIAGPGYRPDESASFDFNCSYYRQDILEGAISEKDSQIAELEVKGVLDESETQIRDALKCERDRLLNRLKTEVSEAIPMNSRHTLNVTERIS